MNDARRARIKNAIHLLETGELGRAQKIIEAVRDEEENSYDNYPENLKDSSAGQRMEEVVETLDDVLEAIDEFISEAIGQLRFVL